jgi:hypothetical protein
MHLMEVYRCDENSWGMQKYQHRQNMARYLLATDKNPNYLDREGLINLLPNLWTGSELTRARHIADINPKEIVKLYGFLETGSKERMAELTEMYGSPSDAFFGIDFETYIATEPAVRAKVCNGELEPIEVVRFILSNMSSPVDLFKNMFKLGVRLSTVQQMIEHQMIRRQIRHASARDEIYEPKAERVSVSHTE